MADAVTVDSGEQVDHPALSALLLYFRPYAFELSSNLQQHMPVALRDRLARGNSLFFVTVDPTSEQRTLRLQVNYRTQQDTGRVTDHGLRVLQSLGKTRAGDSHALSLLVHSNRDTLCTYISSESAPGMPLPCMLMLRDWFVESGYRTYDPNSTNRDPQSNPFLSPYSPSPGYELWCQDVRECWIAAALSGRLLPLLSDLTREFYVHSHVTRLAIQPRNANTGSNSTNANVDSKDQNGPQWCFGVPDGGVDMLTREEAQYNRAVMFVNEFVRDRHGLCGMVQPVFAMHGGIRLFTQCPLFEVFSASGLVSLWWLQNSELRGYSQLVVRHALPHWILVALYDALQAYDLVFHIQ